LSLSPAMSPFSHVAPPFAFIQQAMDKVLNVILTAVLFIITVSLGCTMEIAKITTHLRKRKGMVIAVMAQYGIMPLTAFILAKLFQLGATESLAILICGCCPGGNLSNIFSLAPRGDINLSIVMTTCSTEGDLEGKVPYKGIVTSLVLMLIPCVISIILNEKKPHYTGFIIKAGMVVILLSSAAIIVLSVANVGSGIMVIFSPSLLESFALMPFIGFLLGYIHSAVFQLGDWYVPPLPPPLTLNHQKNREVGHPLLLTTFFTFAPWTPLFTLEADFFPAGSCSTQSGAQGLQTPLSTKSTFIT
uniref:Solute carrier family 10 member 1 n=1 Tax=Bubo bubo TaxID=30461 RepID=A0A8C0EG37_BUBBB